MVNIHITGDKSYFKSKNSVNRFKNKIREIGDPQLINYSDFLKDGCEFKFKEEGEDIYAEIVHDNYQGDNNDSITNDNSLSVHIVGDKSLFKSKNCINKFKAKVKELGDPHLIVKSDFLQDGYEFKFTEENKQVYAEIRKELFLWGDNRKPEDKIAQSSEPLSAQEEGKRRVREKLKYFRDKRNGVHHREMHDIKKSVDKSLFRIYFAIVKHVPDVPIKKPNELLDNPEQYKQEIQMFSSGMVEITKNRVIDNLICSYYKEVSEKVGFEIINQQQLETMFNQLQAQQHPEPKKESEPLPESINLNSYVDSDTESESDVEDVEMPDNKPDDVIV